MAKGKTALFAAVVALGALCAPAAENDSVLYWLVDDSATVGVMGTGIEIPFLTYITDAGYPLENPALSARIRAEGGEFLLLYSLDEDSNIGYFDPGAQGVEFQSLGGHWGAVIPYNQSPLVYDGQDSDGNQVTYNYVPEDSTDLSFFVEIGNYTDGAWTTYLTSDAATYSSLAKYIKPEFNVNTPQVDAWVPHFTIVPEPSAGMLTMLGFALLSLRRRRRS